MKRGSGLGLRFAQEKFNGCWNDFVTDDESELLKHAYGGVWCGMYPREGWKDFIGFEPDDKEYLEFYVVVYPSENGFVLARFLVPRDETENKGFLLWNHYRGSTIFQAI